MRNCSIFGVALVLMFAASSSGQPVTVDILRTGGVVETSLYNDGEAIDLDPLPNPDTVTLIRAYSTNPNNTASIGAIYLGGTRTASGTLDVLIGRAGAIDPDVDEPLLFAATNWSGVTASPSLVNKVRFSGAILGDMSGPINVGEVVRLQCGGHVTGNVDAHNTGLALGRVVARTLAASADITVHHGDVGTLQFTNSGASLSIGGDIAVPEGSIDAILTGGWIGNDDTIAPQILARDGILTLECASVGFGSTVRANAFGGTGPLRRVQTFAIRGTVAGHDLLPDPQSPNGMSLGDLNGLLEVHGNVQQPIAIGNADAIGWPTRGRVHVHGNLHASITCLTSIGEIWVDGTVSRPPGAPPVLIHVYDEGIDIHEIDSLRLGQVLDTLADHIGDVSVLADAIYEFRAESFTGSVVAEFLNGEVLGNAGGQFLLGNAIWAFPGRLDIHGNFGTYNAVAGFDRLWLSPYMNVRIGGEAYGEIELNAGVGLYEQVIFGANQSDPEPETHGWFCTVRRFVTASNIIQMNPSRPQPDQAPYYDRLPADLGGGSIATVPYHLHAAACSPPSNQSNPPVFLNSAFGHVPPAFPGAYAFAEIEKVFYGPIRTASLTEHPVTITRDVPGSPEPPIEGYTVTLKRGDEPGLSRVMTIHGNGSLLLPGTYTIRPKRDTELLEVLRCDGLLTSATVPVADFEYTFVLEGDCNANGEEDLAEIDVQPSKDQWPMNDVIDACEDCFADLNCDFVENGNDVEIMSRAVDGDLTDFCGIDPDFNHDFALNGFDVLDVEVAVGGGSCP